MLNTKQDFVRWMHTMLDPLRPLYSEGGARPLHRRRGCDVPGRHY